MKPGGKRYSFHWIFMALKQPCFYIQYLCVSSLNYYTLKDTSCAYGLRIRTSGTLPPPHSTKREKIFPNRGSPAASGKDFGRETTAEVLETAKAGRGFGGWWSGNFQYHEGFKSSSLRGLYDYGMYVVCVCINIYYLYI